MEEFEPSSDAWNRKWKSSSQVRNLELGMEEFETSLRLCKVPTLVIGNGRVRVKFEAWNWEWRSSSKDRGFESEMEEFELRFDT